MPNRRDFLAGVITASIAGSMRKPAWAANSSNRSSLVPPNLCQAPNYWCTWSAQNYMYGQGKDSIDMSLLEGMTGNRIAHDSITEAVVFGSGGWATIFYPKVRGDLYLLFDDGWQAGGDATFELDPVKFASFTGSPEERLRKLNESIKRAGWRGAALWCGNPPGGDVGHALESRSVKAGIEYWKVDGGDRNFNLTKIRNDAHLPLKLEHAYGEGPVNGDWKRDGRFGPQPWDSPRMQFLRQADVYRTYDVTSVLSLPTTLDRVAEMLRSAAGHPELHGLLNVEDEVYVAAVLGCTMGIMRHPLHGLRPGNDPDLAFAGSRKAKQRMDEVVRAIRWQRIAAPFACGIGNFQISQEILKDGWTFKSGDTWDQEIIGATVWQSAPAVLARNIDIPSVNAKREKPFVFACRFPNGAVAVGAQERTLPGNDWFLPPADVTLVVGEASGPFGIFGEFGQLSLSFTSRLRGKRVIAQDLAGDNPVDLTSDVEFDNTTIHFPGATLKRVGLSNRTPGDLSSPGLVATLV